MRSGCDIGELKKLLSTIIKDEKVVDALIDSVMRPSGPEVGTEFKTASTIKDAVNIAQSINEKDTLTPYDIMKYKELSGKAGEDLSKLNRNELYEFMRLVQKKARVEYGITLESPVFSKPQVSILSALEIQLNAAVKEGNARAVEKISKLIAKVKDSLDAAKARGVTEDGALKLYETRAAMAMYVRMVREAELKASPKAAKIGSLRERAEAVFNSLLDLTKELGGANTDNKKKQLRKKIDKLRKELSGVKRKLSELESDVLDKSKAYQEAMRASDAVIDSWRKSGKLSPSSVRGMIDSALTYSSPRALSEQLERKNSKIRSVKIAFGHIKSLYPDKEIPISVLATLFGKSLMGGNAIDPAKTITHKKADELFEEWERSLRETAIMGSAFLSEYSFFEAERVREMRMLTNDRVKLAELGPDSYVPPSLSEEEASAEGERRGWTPGSVPVENQMDGYTLAVELADIQSQIETLRKMEQFGGFVPGYLLEALFHPTRLNDVNVYTLFSDAAVIDEVDTTEAVDENHKERMFVAFLQNVGMSERDVRKLPELVNKNWENETDKVYVFDMEWDPKSGELLVFAGLDKTRRGTTDLHGILQDGGSVIGPKQALGLLKKLEKLQNAGYKVVNFNGIASDITMLMNTAKRGASETEGIEIENLATRVAFRSIDMMINLEGQIGAKVSLANLAKATQSDLDPSLRKLKSETTKGTDIADLRKIIEDPDKSPTEREEALRTMREYVNQDIEATLAVFDNAERRRRLSPLEAELKITIKRYGGEVVRTVPSLNLSQTGNILTNGRSRIKIKDVFSHYNAGGAIDTILTIIGTEGGSGIKNPNHYMYDLEIIQNKMDFLRNVAIRSSGIDATRVLDAAGSVIATVENADDMELYRTTRRVSKTLLEGVVAINREALEKNGGRFIINRRETDGTDILAESSGVAGEREWQKAAIDSFLEAIDNRRQNIDKIGARVRFRTRKSGESVEQYAIGIIEHFLDLYGDHDVKYSKNMLNYANAKYDYVPAAWFGYGILQIIMGDDITKGISHILRDVEQGDSDTVPDAPREGTNIPGEVTLGTTRKERISRTSPIGLQKLQEAFEDYRLRKRIHHILTTEISDAEAEAMFTRIRKGEVLTSDPEYVLSTKRTMRPSVIPFVNNRTVSSTIPDIDTYINQAIEGMLDIPQLLLAFNHDAIFYGGNLLSFPDATEPKYRPLSAAALDSGVPTGRITMGGIIPLLAWAQSYPITKAGIVDSLKESHKLTPKGGGVGENMSLDSKFNGHHQVAAILLQYMVGRDGGSALATIQDEIGKGVVLVSDEAVEDLYNKTLDLALAKIRETREEAFRSTIRLNKEEADTLDTLEKLLSNKHARDIIKGAVLPRMYTGGFPGVSGGIAKKIQELQEKGEELLGVTKEDVKKLAAFLLTWGDTKKAKSKDRFSDILGNSLFMASAIGTASVLDSALNLTDKQRKQIADIAYKHISKHKLDSVGTEIHFFTKVGEDSRKEAARLIGERIRYMAEATTPPIDPDNKGEDFKTRVEKEVRRLEKRYKERIEKTLEYAKSLKRGRPSTPDEWDTINQILSGDAEITTSAGGVVVKVNAAWKTNRRLRAINAINRVPRRLRADALKAAVATQGFTIDLDGPLPDDMGFLRYVLYARTGIDFFSGRLYQGNENYPISHQGPSLAKFYNDDNLNGLWMFGETDQFSGMSRGDAVAGIRKLVARELMLQYADAHPPEIGDYDMDGEDAAEFMRVWKNRSDLEDERYLEARRTLGDLSPAQRHAATKAGYYAGEQPRWAFEKTLGRGEVGVAEVDNKIRQTPRGPAALIPYYAYLPFSELGSMGLSVAASNMRMSEVSNEFQGMGGTIPDSNNVIPGGMRGFISRYHEKDLPHIPPSPDASAGIYTRFGGEFRLRLEAIRTRKRLVDFANRSGLGHLVADGNWVALSAIYKLEENAANPFLDKIDGMGKLGLSGGGDELSAAKYVYLRSIFQELETAHDALNKDIQLLDLERLIRLDPEELKARTYLSLLILLKDKGINALSSLSFGLTSQSGVFAEDSIERGIDTGTREHVAWVHGHEALQVLNMALNTEDMMIFLTEVNDKEGLGIKGTYKSGGKTYVSLLDVARHEHKEGRNMSVALVDRFMQTDGWKNAVADSMGLYLPTPGTEAYNRAKIDTSRNFDPRPMGGGEPLTVYTARSGTKLLFSPSMINTLLLGIRNDTLLHAAETAMVTQVARGDVESAAQIIQSANRNEFFDRRKQSIADEFDILWMLSGTTGTQGNIKTLSGLGAHDSNGVPLVTYDAIYHLTEDVSKTTGTTVMDEVLIVKMRQAIQKMHDRGGGILRREEVSLLENLLSSIKDDRGLADVAKVAVILAYSGSDPVFQTAAVKEYLGISNDKKVADIIKEARKYADAMVSIVVGPLEGKNKYLYVASAAIERFALGDVGQLADAISISGGAEVRAFMGVNEADPADVEQASRAIAAASRFYPAVDIAEMPSMTGMDPSLFTDEAAFRSQFAYSPTLLAANEQINTMVNMGVITKEVGEFYRGLVAAIAIRNPNMVQHLSLSYDPDADRAGYFKQEGNKYSIILGKPLAGRPAIDQVRILAHELTHMAQRLYMRTGSTQYAELKMIMQSRAGQESMRMMLGIMRGVDEVDVDAEMDYYARNPDEFIAEWGAYLLLKEFVIDRGMVDSIESALPDKMTSFWSKAFARIKRTFRSLLTAMDLMKAKNPEVYERMHSMLDSMFNFTGRGVFGDIVKYDEDVRYEAGVRKSVELSNSRLEEEVMTPDSSGVMMAVRYDELMVKGRDGLNSTEMAELANIDAWNTAHNGYLSRVGFFGISEHRYLTILHNLRGNYEITPMQSKEEQAVLCERALRKTLEARGIRLDDPSTVAGKAREIEGILYRVFEAAGRASVGANWNEATERPRIESIVGFIVGGIGEQFNILNSGIKQTWDSFLPPVIALSYLIDSTSSVTSGSLLQVDGLRDTHAGTIAMQSILASMDADLAHLNRKYGGSVGKITQASQRMRFTDPLNDATIYTSLTPDERADARELSTRYEKAAGLLINLAIDLGIGGKDIVDIDTSYWAFTVERDLVNSEKPQDRLTVANAERALMELQGEKLKDNIREDGTVDSITLLGSGLLPFVDRDRPDILLERLRSMSAAPGSSDTAIMFRILDGRGEVEYRALGRTGTWGIMSIEAKAEYIARAIKTIIIGSEAGTLRWSDILGRTTAAEFVTIRARMESAIDGDYPGVRVNLGQAERYKMVGVTRWGNTIKDRGYIMVNSSTVTGYYIKDLLDRAGSTAYLPSLSKLGLNVRDVWRQTSRRHEEARAIFSHDPRRVLRGLRHSIGNQAVERNVIETITGVKGLNIRLFMEMIEENANGLSNLDENRMKPQISDMKKYMLESLEILRRKLDLEEGVGERYEKVWGHQLADISAVTTSLAWGGNLNLATVVAEVPVSILKSLMHNTGTVNLVANLFYGFITNFFVLQRHLSGVERSEFIAGALNALHDSGGAWGTTGTDPDIMDAEKGMISKGWGWTKRMRMIASLSLNLSLRRNGSRYLMNNTQNLINMRTDLSSTGGHLSIKELKRIAKKHGVRMNYLPIRMALESNLLGGKNLEIIQAIMGRHPGIMGSPNLLEAQKDFLDLARVGGNRVDLGGGLVVSEMDVVAAFAAYGVFQEKFVGMGSVVNSVMDTPTPTSAWGWAMKHYRTYSILHSNQKMYRDSARLGILDYAITSVAWLIMDTMYTMLIAFLSGWLKYDELKKTYKKDKVAFLEMIFPYAAKAPWAGRGTSEALQLLYLATQGSSIKNLEFDKLIPVLPLSFTATASMAKSVYGAGEDLWNGEVRQAMWKIHKYIPLAGDSIARLIMNAVMEDSGVIPNKNSRRNAGRSLGTRNPSIYDEGRRFLDNRNPNASQSLWVKDMLEYLVPGLVSGIRGNEMKKPMPPKPKMSNAVLRALNTSFEERLKKVKQAPLVGQQAPLVGQQAPLVEPRATNDTPTLAALSDRASNPAQAPEEID